MKHGFLYLIFWRVICLGACTTNEVPNEKTAANTGSPKTFAATGSEVNTNAGDAIIGSWKFYLGAYGRNENQVLDDDERKRVPIIIPCN